ncbi:inositol monophosphatase family protein [Microvirga sp. CF3062]|uniref:inositol monophosphatase family protein n=1 Tax=Microvirga sp. CF3062 TaxID=3110182 RepID=UPI002E7A07DF|nr:inositol monophosphatase family protein [Microvirga sp. CF3062]MEE1657490.1 inositol monophosphatase family protein [Microvirga sp. CF3062]
MAISCDDKLIDQGLAFALAVCTEAGDILREIRREGRVAVEGKDEFELVTNADLAVDRHFKERIAQTFKGHAVLSEEDEGSGNSSKALCWVIDPLDGTANFVHGHDHVAVSAALRIDGVSVLGVVHAPFQGQTFWAAAGRGAYRNGERIKASSLTDVRRALIGTGFPHHRARIDEVVDRLKPLLREFGDIRRLAAPALDICWVADGRLTGFVDRIHEWDVAAAGLIAMEAGARMTVLKPAEGDDGTDYLIAAPGIFERLCAVLR